MKGRQSVERWVTLRPGEYKSLSLALPTNTPFVSLRSNPPGALVKVDGVEVGQTPLIHGVSAGAHDVTFELAGHGSKTQSITLTERHTRSAPLEVAVGLSKVSGGGFLSLDTGNGEGTVQIDGKPIGMLPLQAPISLSSGMHRVEIYQGSELVHEEVVRIEGGQTTLATISIGSAGLSNRTIGWIGMGVGGATTLGGLLTGFMAMSADGDLQDCRSDVGCARSNQELDLANDVRGKAQMTDVLVGTGLVVAGVGLWFYLMDDDDDVADNDVAAERIHPPSLPSVGHAEVSP